MHDILLRARMHDICDALHGRTSTPLEQILETPLKILFWIAQNLLETHGSPLSAPAHKVKDLYNHQSTYIRIVEVDTSGIYENSPKSVLILLLHALLLVYQALHRGGSGTSRACATWIL